MERMESAGVEDLPKIAEWLLSASTYSVIAFQGEMGAGKTTLIKAIGKHWEVEDEISSPTFSLVNEYLSRQGKIYHFDFYRLQSEEEALDIGFDEYLDSGNLCLIEWPEKIRNFLPRECSLVRIHLEGAKRIYELKQPIDE